MGDNKNSQVFKGNTRLLTVSINYKLAVLDAQTSRMLGDFENAIPHGLGLRKPCPTSGVLMWCDCTIQVP